MLNRIKTLFWRNLMWKMQITISYCLITWSKKMCWQKNLIKWINFKWQFSRKTKNSRQKSSISKSSGKNFNKLRKNKRRHHSHLSMIKNPVSLGVAFLRSNQYNRHSKNHRNHKNRSIIKFWGLLLKNL
jgi:hypothetical protein